MQRRIATVMKIFGILGILLAMATCLHQCKVIIKKKLRVWRAQKFYLLGCANTAPTCTGQQTTSCLAEPYWESNRNFQLSGLPITIVPCWHQFNVYIKRKLRGWRVQKCNFLVSAKNRTDRYGSTNYPVSCNSVSRQQ